MEVLSPKPNDQFVAIWVVKTGQLARGSLLKV